MLSHLIKLWSYSHFHFTEENQDQRGCYFSEGGTANKWQILDSNLGLYISKYMFFHHDGNLAPRFMRNAGL